MLTYSGYFLLLADAVPCSSATIDVTVCPLVREWVMLFLKEDERDAEVVGYA
jgi:hypothetical protein